MEIIEIAVASWTLAVLGHPWPERPWPDFQWKTMATLCWPAWPDFPSSVLWWCACPASEHNTCRCRMYSSWWSVLSWLCASEWLTGRQTIGIGRGREDLLCIWLRASNRRSWCYALWSGWHFSLLGLIDFSNLSIFLKTYRNDGMNFLKSCCRQIGMGLRMFLSLSSLGSSSFGCSSFASNCLSAL